MVGVAYAIGATDIDALGHAEEDAMLDDANRRLDASRQRGDVRRRFAGQVEDVMATITDEGRSRAVCGSGSWQRAPCDVTSWHRQPRGGMAPAKLLDFDGDERASGERRDDLRLIHQDDAIVAGGGDQLLT